MQIAGVARTSHHHERILNRRASVLHSAPHHKAVSCAELESLVLASHAQIAVHDINDLIVHMAMLPSHPALVHFVLD